MSEPTMITLNGVPSNVADVLRALSEQANETLKHVANLDQAMGVLAVLAKKHVPDFAMEIRMAAEHFPENGLLAYLAEDFETLTPPRLRIVVSNEDRSR